MKKRISYITLLLVTFMASSSLLALEDPFGKPGDYGYAGCGLGSVVVDKDGPQLFASTTNAVGYQLVAITFGTSNCDAGRKGKTSYIQKQRENFVSYNYDQLRREMASGQGENLESLGILMGCSHSQSTAFATMSRQNYAYFFEISSKEPKKFLDRVQKSIMNTKNLATTCQSKVEA